jgi:hypothetical protein
MHRKPERFECRISPGDAMAAKRWQQCPIAGFQFTPAAISEFQLCATRDKQYEFWPSLLIPVAIRDSAGGDAFHARPTSACQFHKTFRALFQRGAFLQ